MCTDKKSIAHAPLCNDITENSWLVWLRERRREIPCIQTTMSSPPLRSFSPPSAPSRPFQVPEEVAAILLHLYGYANHIVHIEIIKYSETT